MPNRRFRDIYYRFWKLPLLRWQHRRRVQLVRRNGYARVVFLAVNLPMWRYDGVLRLMLADKRFRCQVVFHSFAHFPADEKRRNWEVLREHFLAMGIGCTDATTAEGMAEALRVMSEADIIFYPQPYGKMYENQLDNEFYRDRLLCYTPYAFDTVSADFTFNTALHNQAWRVFRESAFHLEESRRLSHNRGSNVVVVGNPRADDFAQAALAANVWKPQASPCKKVIWAPHFSIEADTAMQRNSFLWLAELMPRMAARYAGRLQMAFKPHPKLFAVLCDRPDWGRQRTEAYYQMWADMENGQCEQGDYAALFMQSDAIIHDCGSFTVEYLLTGHPAMFVTTDIEGVKSRVNDFGRQALAQYYIGSCEADITRFIDDVVLSGHDPMRDARETFRRESLMQPDSQKGKTVAQAIYGNIVKALTFSEPRQ